jgi:uncharacterized membrane protein
LAAVAVVGALAAAVAVTLAAVARQEAGKKMILKLKTMLRHLWLDASDAQNALPPDMLQRLTQRVAASEGRHTGQIRIYVEAALPMSYLLRIGETSAMKALIRQRAVMLFGKLRLWDTEHNNGVLIYLQLAEHAIEIVADRGVNRHVSAAGWQAMSDRMGAAFRAGQFEEGLTQAIGEVSSVLVAHFPSAPGGHSVNEQPDEPVLG